MNYSAEIEKLKRNFVPGDFKLTDWEHLESFFKNLLDREITNREDLEQWLKDCSELEAVVSEDACWRQIKMTCDTENKALEEAFRYFVMQIQPHIQPYSDKLNKKLIESPFTSELDQQKYFTYLRSVKKNIELFREKSIPLYSELSVLAQQYGVISGKMTIRVNDKEFTLQQASKFLKNHDRALREEVYTKIQQRRLQDKDSLNEMYTQLIQKRHQEPWNADFQNYRDYKFVDMGRFDYTKEDCFQFHEAVKKHVMPLVDIIYENKRKKLNLDTLRPWDVEAEAEGVTPLNPFKDSEELVEKSISCFHQLRPFFGECLKK